MPIEIKVTKEIGNYEPKFIGPLTLRQFVTFGAAAGVAIFLYKTVRIYAPKTVASYVCAIPAVIAALLNTKPYGMRPERFLQAVFVNMFLAPSHRRYRTENTMEERLEKLRSMGDALETVQKPPEGQKKRGITLFGKSKSSGDSKPAEQGDRKSGKKDKKSKAEQKRKNYKMSSKAIR